MSIRQGSTIIAGSSGSGGTSNYNNLENKPSINGITLEGNKTTEDLNINSLPDQTGNEGKVLITNGTEASWQTLPETGLPLFAHIWSDHLLTNSSYLRADTFSWQDGNIYYTAYNELVNEKNLTTETSTDTINNITITYYRTPKGYKIVLPDMADNLIQLYENTGTAWYYILDIDNTRFKLPRNSRYESGTTTDNAGDFEAETLTNSTNNEINLNHVTQFLYFYVGNTIQNETTINVAEITEALNNKADRDFGNITDGTYDFLTTKQITNCITAIPQDIKLEIRNGYIVATDTCTVYKGNGSTYTIPASTNFSHATSAGTFMLIWTGVGARHQNTNLCFSGSTAPAQGSFSGRVAAWYDTTNKVIKLTNDGGSTWIGDNSFPLCVYKSTGSAATSIDQVFNGFGYIGSTVFVLPGVEGLIPNGFVGKQRSNTKQVINSVRTYSFEDTTTGEFVLQINKTGLGIVLSNWYKEVNTLPSYTSLSGWSVYYLIPENFMYLGNGTTDWSIQESMICGSFTCENGRITSFAPKTTFQAVDRNDTEWASTASKPSDRYVSLSVQASGTQYTAPANGWFQISGKATQNGGFVILDNPQKFVSYMSTNSVGNYDRGFIPASKGNKITLLYGNYEIESEFFKFVYDEGSK